VKRRIRWAMFTAFLSVVLAVALGISALIYSDEEKAVATPAGPIEGNYAFVATTIRLSLPSSSVSPIDQVVTGGRLSIGADGHVAWSLQVAGSNDASASGRLSCEGSYDRVARTILPEPRFGFSGFPAGMDRREVQDLFYARFCRGAPAGGTIGRPWQLQNETGVLHLRGAGGSISWRRE
jgi:hypothetical protein